ncbi:MAG: M28 family metallopeptidase [Eubacteriaceae bacterium]|nr:M28 family metallopeptidase [Eubacteriaceae bacterium]
MIKKQVSSFADQIFDRFETRFNKKEKATFIEFAKANFIELGYSSSTITIQESIWGKNLVVGDPGADILITAHYDTPASNGHIALPAREFLGTVYSTVASLVLMAFLFMLIGYASSIIPSALSRIVYNLLAFGFIIFLFTVKNMHNHNDNTSGVVGVFNMAAKVSQNEALKGKVCFVLFDSEELGLLGSMAFAKYRKTNFPDKAGSLVINLDCIGNGDRLLVSSKSDHELWHAVASFFETEGFQVEKKRASIFYMSDNVNFERGVLLSFVKQSTLGHPYMPLIHTNKDMICDIELINRLCESIYKYVSL